ncbi:cyclase family protein [Rickettsiales endosymbiont of Peranema trichophorum]|uniref:cyclase family protein n=1 Tax=Rickettsiales endosymbiont of Peranema trichophorum TaxID=2486577 RepID=UPI001A921174|nr:cyclase family protein [Rickettsiales endosymbiont of Peranema trichophorum]
MPGDRCIHDFDPNDLMFPCVVIDVSEQSHERYSLSTQDVRDFESKFGAIVEGSCVMVKTGWSKFWNEPRKYHNNHVFPSISSEAASLLLKKNVASLGIDTLSPDRPEDGFKVHRLFLGAGKILVENVANLDKMPESGAVVIVCPIKIKDGTEAPVRLIGLIEK